MRKHPIYVNPALRRLINEYAAIRDNNQRARAGDHARGEALFSEGALALVVVERFLRVLLGPEAANEDTLPNLLEKAMSDRLVLLDPPIYFPGLGPVKSKEISTQIILSLRNPLLHGNYEQAARECPSVEEYLDGGTYRADLESVYEFMASMFRQFDLETGERVAPTERALEMEDQRRREARTALVSAFSRRTWRLHAARNSKRSDNGST